MNPLKLVIGNKRYSSWSLRAWLLLKHAGISFEETQVFLYKENTDAEIRRFSPSGKVPVLLDGDFLVWESLAIAEYLAEHFPGAKLWPDDFKARAVARSISSEMHAGFQDLRQNLPMNCRKRALKSLAPEAQEDINRIQQIWRDTREKYGKNGEMLFGRFSVADAMYAPVAVRFMVYDVKLDPVSEAYKNAVLALSAMRQWLEEANQESERVPALE